MSVLLLLNSDPLIQDAQESPEIATEKFIGFVVVQGVCDLLGFNFIHL